MDQADWPTSREIHFSLANWQMFELREGRVRTEGKRTRVAIRFCQGMVLRMIKLKISSWRIWRSEGELFVSGSFVMRYSSPRTGLPC